MFPWFCLLYIVPMFLNLCHDIFWIEHWLSSLLSNTSFFSIGKRDLEKNDEKSTGTANNNWGKNKNESESYFRWEAWKASGILDVKGSEKTFQDN